MNVGELTQMSDEIRVWWYDCDCPWQTKYCDEHHSKSALVPAAAFQDLVEHGDEWDGITVRGLPARSSSGREQ